MKQRHKVLLTVYDEKAFRRFQKICQKENISATYVLNKCIAAMAQSGSLTTPLPMGREVAQSREECVRVKNLGGNRKC